MNKVPLKELKKDLSSWAEEASKGNIIEVTKYNRPYIYIVPHAQSGLFQGSKVGQGSLTSILSSGSQGKWLEYLEEDRNS